MACTPTSTSCSSLPPSPIKSRLSRKEPEADMGLSAVEFDSNRSPSKPHRLYLCRTTLNYRLSIFPTAPHQIVYSRTTILDPGYFLGSDSDCSMMKAPQTTSLSQLPNFVVTPIRNNQEDVFQRLSQSLGSADDLLQTSISFPTHSTEYSFRGWIHDEGRLSGRATGYPFSSESSRLSLDYRPPSAHPIVDGVMLPFDDESQRSNTNNH